jgi:cell division septation protein DedD
MSRKSPQPKKKGSEKAGRAGVQFTRKELGLWLGVVFLVMVWMFTLGVVVGRGLSPIRFDVDKLTKELTALKKQALSREKEERHMETASRNTPLGFYEALTDKKEKARSRSKAKEKPTKRLPQRQGPGNAALKTPQKTGDEPMASVDQQGPSPGTLTLQVASLRDSTGAAEMVSYLRSKGYSAYQVTAEVPGKGVYHRVRVGHFKDRSAARQTAAGLRQEELEPFIIKE